MLKSSQRISRKDFPTLIESRKFFNGEGFVLRVASHLSPKVAVSVSKKVAKSAVVRNSIRRRAYSALRDLWPELRSGLYLFVAKPGALRFKGEALRSEIAKLIKLSSK